MTVRSCFSTTADCRNSDNCLSLVSVSAAMAVRPCTIFKSLSAMSSELADNRTSAAVRGPFSPSASEPELTIWRMRVWGPSTWAHFSVGARLAATR